MRINTISTAFAAAATVAAGAAGLATAATAAADEATEVASHNIGQPVKVVNGDNVQSWTISDLKPSSDPIPYQVHGTLWEATATDEAVEGSVTPIVSNLNARAQDGQNYRALFQVASPAGVNPATIPQGEKTTGKVYFDVTGANPQTVAYNAGGQDLAVWQHVATPEGQTGSRSTSVPANNQTTPSRSRAATPTAAGDRAPAANPADARTEGAPLPATAQGTPVAAGSQGTPLPAGSQGTPLPSGTEGAPLPASTQGTPAPAGSQGTPVPAGSQGTPLQQEQPNTQGAPLPANTEGAPLPASTQGTPAPAGSQGTPVPAGQQAPAPAAPAPNGQQAPAPAAPAPNGQQAPAPAAPAPNGQQAPAANGEPTLLPTAHGATAPAAGQPAS